MVIIIIIFVAFCVVINVQLLGRLNRWCSVDLSH